MSKLTGLPWNGKCLQSVGGMVAFLREREPVDDK